MVKLKLKRNWCLQTFRNYHDRSVSYQTNACHITTLHALAFPWKDAFALPVMFQQPLSPRTRHHRTTCATLVCCLVLWLPLFQQPGRWLQAPFIRRSSCVRVCGWEVVSLEPGLLKPEAALLRYACRRRALGGSVETGCSPPPPRGNRAEYLWSKPKSRKAADYQAPAARRLPAVWRLVSASRAWQETAGCFFFFFNVKGWNISSSVEPMRIIIDYYF